VLLTPRTIELVADRIERAYLRRSPSPAPFIGNARVWTIAAQALLEAHHRHTWLPLDPELFVAAQASQTPMSDPWSDLAPPNALRRYRRQVLQIIQGLRRELRAEIRRAERLVRRGQDPRKLLAEPRRWLSPLGAYVAAYRLQVPDLMEQWRPRARDQHDACPLYRLACRGFLPSSAYPVSELLPGLHLTPRIGPRFTSFSKN
jgi:hypothetical protein